MYGVETVPGKPADPKEMQTLGSSIYGSSFLVPTQLDGATTKQGDRHFYAKQHHLNWNPLSLARGLENISHSIANTLSFLLSLNGEQGEEIYFSLLDELGELEAAWRDGPGVLSMNMGASVQEKLVRRRSNEDILDSLRARPQCRNVPTMSPATK